jgi:hypothetical protein
VCVSDVTSYVRCVRQVGSALPRACLCPPHLSRPLPLLVAPLPLPLAPPYPPCFLSSCACAFPLAHLSLRLRSSRSPCSATSRVRCPQVYALRCIVVLFVVCRYELRCAVCGLQVRAVWAATALRPEVRHRTSGARHGRTPGFRYASGPAQYGYGYRCPHSRVYVWGLRASGLGLRT